jgi:aminoglycoside phosphotransferase
VVAPLQKNRSLKIVGSSSTLNFAVKIYRLTDFFHLTPSTINAARMMLQEERFKGLQWVPTPVSLEPRWTVEPDLESIKRTIEEVRPSQEVRVSFLAQGAFNKIYDIQAGNQDLIMRVSLPVDPQYKTLSEVATMDWMRHHTSLPVPEIIAYYESRKNAIGFEWILMKKIPGKPLADAWKSIQYPAKEQLVQQLATYSSSLFKNQLRGIGNIYPDPSSPSSHGGSSDVKRIVSMQFFWGDHILQDVPRGPFHSSKDWISTCLSLNEHDCKSTLAKYENRDDLGSDDEDEVEDTERTLAIIERLETHMNEYFSDPGQDPEPSILFHDDISQHNILVDDSGTLTGVVDWECVSALPLWKACYYPFFLEGRPRDEEPDRHEYRHTDDGEPNNLYWEHLMEYELTKLRRYFLDEMQRLEPKWVEVFNSAKARRDFHIAVQNCDNELCVRHINEWLDDIATGEGTVRSLRDRIDES